MLTRVDARSENAVKQNTHFNGRLCSPYASNLLGSSLKLSISDAGLCSGSVRLSVTFVHPSKAVKRNEIPFDGNICVGWCY